MERIDDLQKVTRGCLLLQRPEELSFRHIETDSRHLSTGGATLFIALKGPFHDAHDHLAEVLEKGVTNFVVSEQPPAELIDRANWLLVKDTLDALQAIAAHHRAKFSLPVIAITGSNGKTWVKEWLSQLLEKRIPLVKSPKSYNSQVGVSLSVLTISEQHRLGIFEAGISRPLEMGRLEKIIRPEIGILTCIGDAHSANFKDDQEKLQEKWTLFQDCKKIVCCIDQPLVEKIAAEPGSAKVWKWSAKGHPLADVNIRYATKGGHTTIEYLSKSFSGSVEIPFDDEVSRWNASVCISTLISMEMDPGELTAEFAALEPIGMRMELVEGRDGSLLINDSYNADMEGLKKALSFMQLHGKGREKWAIISDLPESSADFQGRYWDMADSLRHFKVSRVIGIGQEITGMAPYLEPGIIFDHFKDKEDLLNHLEQTDLKNKIILFKAARKYRLDQVCESLEQVTHMTELEINLNALRLNLEVFRQMLSGNTGIIAVIKAAAYGIGSREIARFLEEVNIERLAVAYTDEGIELRKMGVRTPIIVLNPDPSTFELMINHELEPEIYSLKRLQEWIRVSNRSPYAAKAHLKMETGMNRLGIGEEQMGELCNLLSEHKNVVIASVMSHLAASEDPRFDEFSRQQVGRFIRMYEKVARTLGYIPDRHVLNSNGIIRFPEYHFEAVRLGIGLYGVGTSLSQRCIPVHRLVSRIAQIKDIGAGDGVGYSRSFVAEGPMTIATINLGYADGLPRSAGNGRFSLFLKGHPCRILGNVCMDMTMIDVTHVPDVKEGDEVVVFGPEHPMDNLAAAAGTIPYEILTGIGPRVKRRFIEE